MKKILGLAIAAIIIIAVAGVGSFAYFSDTEKSADNYVTAGTLDLTIGGTTPYTFLTDSAFVPTAANGSGAAHQSISLKNDGATNISGKLDIKITNAGQDAAGFPTGKLHAADGTTVVTVGDLGTASKVAIWLSTTASATPPAYSILLNPGGTTTDLGASPSLTGRFAPWVTTTTGYIGAASSPTYASRPNTTGETTWTSVPIPNGSAGGTTYLTANSTIYMHFTYYLPDDTTHTVNNKVQGLKLYTDFLYSLHQD